MAIINKKSLKSKKAVALLLFFLYLGAISMAAQIKPRTYVAENTTEIINIDGKMDEVSWSKTSWSSNFVDIEGIIKPTYETKFKMLWDDTNIYFFAELKEPHVWATLKQKDTIIFYDNDFEIFLDPDGDTHNYYELEMNALNTIWDLYLSKPYRNNGYVMDGWDFKGIQSAVQVNGTLNNSTDIDEGWTIEIAIPWSFTTTPGGTTRVPENESWRINFSRVNWDFDLENGRYTRKKDAVGNFLPEYNWVWSPQGVINMHEPEHWGYVYFSKDNSTEFTISEDEYIKWYMYELYRNIKNNNEQGWDLKDGKFQREVQITKDKPVIALLEKNNFGFAIWVKSPFTNNKLVIHTDGKFETYHDKTD
ncbi:carbohydrate binding protein with CBM9 domain [Maribacter caenipelagi]|uniref:Carbohydrate binding protein with CBM9 domain n=1 Tax=Maribacter caenipelagi TaxID=1447781 RepID=A0A4R7DCE5_9FLAO|nr:carbohydrate-binding family 9-like protein [Maribacter caenipelagi]TDS19083.1 carbohydrate binding protein with CBM9 domain [Maribacter caenipelagi]